MKKLNFRHLCLAVWLGMASLSCAQNKATFEIKEEEKLIEFTTDRFTLPNLHVTPNGESIIFDVLGDIYQVSIEGGKAKVLLQDNNWKRGAKLSPDGSTLAYISDETGEFQVWTYNLKSKKKRVYPIKESFHYPLYAYWDRNGKLLIPSEKGLINYDVDSGKSKMLRPVKEEERSIMHTVNRKLTVNKTGTHAYYQFDGVLWAYDLNENIDKYIGRFEEYRNKTIVNVSPNGNINLYYTKSKDTLGEIDLILWNLETNARQSLIKVNDLGFSANSDYSFDFINDSTIVLDKEGEIIRMNLESGEYESISIEVEVKKVIKKPLQRKPQYIKDSIITASVLRNPVTRPGLDTIYFGAFGKLHSYAISSRYIKELYPNQNRFEVSPSLSPDGNYLAYTTWNDMRMGHLYIRELKSGKEFQITKTPGRYINPAWSTDGSTIVFIEDETETIMGISRQSSGTSDSSHTLSLYSINFNDFIKTKCKQSLEFIYTLFPSSNMPRRFYPVLTFSSSNSKIYVNSRDHENNFAAIFELDISTKKVNNKSFLPSNIEEVVVSPKGKYAAFIFDEQVWIDSYPYAVKLNYSPLSEFMPEQYYYNNGVVDSIDLSNAMSIYQVAPSYLYWQDQYTLMWGSAEEVYAYDVRTEKTEKIADIKVQKPRAVSKTQYALTNARIITMNKQDEVIEKGTILIKDNRIETVGKISEISIPENYKIFDLEGKTIMPGLIDVHAHNHLVSFEFQQQQNHEYIGNLAFGITSVYDPSLNVLDYRERAQMVETGQILGPRVFASGNPISTSYGINSFDFKKITSEKDAYRIVTSLTKLNVFGPIKEYRIRNVLKRNMLAAEVKNKNYRITAHQEQYKYVPSRIINGYDGIEHEIGTFILQNDFINLLVESGIHYTPTYIVSPGINNIFNANTIDEIKKLKRFNAELLYHKRYEYKEKLTESKNRLEFLGVNNIQEHNRAIGNLKEIVRMGGRVTVGGHGDPLPGIGTHWEIWFLTKAMCNYRAIQAATIDGAKKLDLQEELGSVEIGKLTDLIVLNSNPLIDIFNTVDILYTIQNGNIYESETMKQIHPIEKELLPWGWDSPTIKKKINSKQIR